MQPLGVGGVDVRDFEVKNCYESSGRDWSARSAPIGGERVCLKWVIERWRASVPVSLSVCEVDVLVFVGLRVLHQNCCVVRVKADSRVACPRDIIDVDVK
ncbi:hypothetical protein TNCV_4493611 [Trichonephila clavipes]|uniref:Uncharacterized protein n=1 Tax=Trichonephila clavipes TaxID=2585209 RepID=A0A8X6SYE7_TRICX|nr:hypothetical protein TNCV_4493611 [Trichonephila clavipes]